MDTVTNRNVNRITTLQVASETQIHQNMNAVSHFEIWDRSLNCLTGTQNLKLELMIASQ